MRSPKPAQDRWQLLWPLLFSCVSCLISAGCAGRAPETYSSPSLGSLQSRHRTLVILGPDHFRLYTREGALIADGLRERDLAARYPDMLRTYQMSFARRTPAPAAPVIDASLHLPSPSHSPSHSDDAARRP